MFMTSREPGNSQVFHDLDNLRKRWGQFLEILSVTPEGYGYQTAITLTNSRCRYNIQGTKAILGITETS